MVSKQKTIKNFLMIEGIGVHSGLPASLILKPAPEDHGIIFYNIRFPDQPILIGKVIPENAQYATVIRSKNWHLSTIEHLMAAIIGLGIDNLIIEADGFEVPIMDGSAKPFIESILSIGIETQKQPKNFLTPKEILKFIDNEHGREIEIIPAKKCGTTQVIDNSLYVDYQADFDHPLLGVGKIKCVFSDDFFIQEIAPARTFGFLDQLPIMRKNGLAKGASLENTVVIGEGGFLNTRRFNDEFVRHKFLDLIGDLAMLGQRLAGSVIAKRTGHSFNRVVVEHFLQNPSKWEII